ncbi:MAG TPA: poly-gamma-glutamate biosynthesis protein PgsC [Myxococcota bacterium]|nr:poly-gamma-glutamate biosynthesis protein PgsC [Myxococcota bacterium]
MELNLLALSIGLGLAVSLLFSELFGLAVGGLVVPGYIALYLTRPIDLAITLAAALLTFFLIRIASTFVIIYGRRRTAAMILVGYAAGVLLSAALAAFHEVGAEAMTPMVVPPADALAHASASRGLLEAGVIGYIVPGLIAIWLDRQGIVPTIAALVTSAVVVRLLLILVVPQELQWFEAAPDLLPELEEVVLP